MRPSLAAAGRCWLPRTAIHGSGGEQPVRRPKKIGLPGRPVVAIRAALAAYIPRGAWAFTIEVVADMDDESRLSRSGGRAQPRERPFRPLVAVLEASGPGVVVVRFLLIGRLEPAAGVAERRDRAKRRLRQGSLRPPIAAELVPGGIGASQTRTWNAASAPARTLIRSATPPTSIVGHSDVFERMARAIAPSSPSTT